MTETPASRFDRLADELQQMILDEVRSYYSPQVVEEWMHPKNLGRLSAPDASAVVNGGCGDTMAFYLRVQGRQVAEATFATNGCGPTIACGSRLTSMARGRSLEQALQITASDLLDALGGLPPENVHCAQLAVNTLRAAISEYTYTHQEELSVTTQHPLPDTATREEVAQRAGDLMRAGYH